MSKYLMIALGGALGALSRYGLGGVVQRWAGPRFPYGTLVINVTGCFVIGIAMTLVTERPLLHPNWRFLVPVGFIGAYTTFSTFEYETYRALEQGAPLVALSNIFVSVIVGFAGVAAGVMLTRSML